MFITMDKKKFLTKAEIEKLVEEPEHDYIEKFATISDDKKSLLVRIPQEITKIFKINQGDKIRFYTEFHKNKRSVLAIELRRKDAIRQD